MLIEDLRNEGLTSGDLLLSMEGCAIGPSIIQPQHTHHAWAGNRQADLAFWTGRAKLPGQLGCGCLRGLKAAVSSGEDAMLPRVKNVQLKNLKE